MRRKYTETNHHSHFKHTPQHNSVKAPPPSFKTMLSLIRKQRKLQHKQTHTHPQKVEEMSKFYCFGPPRKCKTKQNFVTETKVQNLSFRHNLKKNENVL